MNYKMKISYDGTRYQGWERQKNTDMTIQGKIEAVLSVMVGGSVEIIGSGRTDAGVHARGQVANVHMSTDKTPEEIKDYLNQYLPEDICVQEVRMASERFHSRYNAQGKTYRYTCYVGKGKPVFDRKYVYKVEEPLDLEKMRRAAEDLVGTHDFAGFCSNPKMKKSTVRCVDSISIEQQEDYLVFTYHGNGFLHHMVRILTGTLLEVGMGKRDPQSMPELLESKKRALAGFTAPSQGLCMMEVDY